MKIFGIAKKVSQVYGQGDYGDEYLISPQGSYGYGEYPPVFESREEAQKYLNGMEYFTGKVVELNYQVSGGTLDSKNK